MKHLRNVKKVDKYSINTIKFLKENALVFNWS